MPVRDLMSSVSSFAARLRAVWAPPWTRRTAPAAEVRASRWLVRAVEDLRRLGFFAGDADLTATELAAQIQADHLADSGRPLAEATVHADLLIAKQDPSRVWCQRISDAPAANGYPEALRSWAEISRGAFDPVFIDECWASPKGPVTLSFVHAGHDVALHPNCARPTFDLTILRPINQLIAATGIWFAVHEPCDDEAIVIAVNAAEFEQLTKQRGWRLRAP